MGVKLRISGYRSVAGSLPGPTPSTTTLIARLVMPGSCFRNSFGVSDEWCKLKQKPFVPKELRQLVPRDIAINCQYEHIIVIKSSWKTRVLDAAPGDSTP